MALSARILKSETLKVSLCAMPEMGTLIPLMHLGMALQERGHKVTFITFGYGKDKLEKLLKDNKVDAETVVVAPNQAKDELFGTSGTNMLANTLKLKNDVKSAIHKHPGSDLVIADPYSFVFLQVADSQNIPSILFNP